MNSRQGRVSEAASVRPQQGLGVAPHVLAAAAAPPVSAASAAAPSIVSAIAHVLSAHQSPPSPPAVLDVGGPDLADMPMWFKARLLEARGVGVAPARSEQGMPLNLRNALAAIANEPFVAEHNPFPSHEEVWSQQGAMESVRLVMFLHRIHRMDLVPFVAFLSMLNDSKAEGSPGADQLLLEFVAVFRQFRTQNRNTINTLASKNKDKILPAPVPPKDRPSKNLVPSFGAEQRAQRLPAQRAEARRVEATMEAFAFKHPVTHAANAPGGDKSIDTASARQLKLRSYASTSNAHCDQVMSLYTNDPERHRPPTMPYFAEWSCDWWDPRLREEDDEPAAAPAAPPAASSSAPPAASSSSSATPLTEHTEQEVVGPPYAEEDEYEEKAEDTDPANPRKKRTPDSRVATRSKRHC